MGQDVKPFKTIEEQINILEDRGLIIEDEEFAKKSLSNLNYYRLSAYTLTLRKDNLFYDNVRFSDVIIVTIFAISFSLSSRLSKYFFKTFPYIYK